MAELQLAQTDTERYFRILPNLPVLGTKSWRGTSGNQGGWQGGGGIAGREMREKSSLVLFNSDWKRPHGWGVGRFMV